MNESAISELLRVRDNVCEVARDYETKFKGLVLQRAKEKSVYLPLAKYVFKKGGKPFETEYISKIFLGSADKEIHLEVYNHNTGNGCRFKVVPLKTLEQEMRREVLLSVDYEILKRQERLRTEYREFFTSFEYYLADSRFRHTIVESIKRIYFDNETLFGNEFVLTATDWDFKKTITLRYDDKASNFRCSEEGMTYPRFLNDYNVEILKLLKDCMLAKLYKLKQERNEI